MGRRKERRLAALSAAGRRVKLDLFAESAGEVSSTSLHDEAGVDLGQEKCAGVPTSPSSSGPKQDNPLLLLGQYSDDEADENISKRSKFTSVWISSNNTNGKMDRHVDSNEDTICKFDKNMANDTNMEPDLLDAKNDLRCDEAERSDIINVPGPCTEVNSTAQTSVPDVSGMQIVGDFPNGWKIVMRDESNQYYYWNPQTGETSWEVPDVQASMGVVAAELTVFHNSSTTSTAYASNNDTSNVNVTDGQFISASVNDGKPSGVDVGFDANNTAECEMGTGIHHGEVSAKSDCTSQLITVSSGSFSTVEAYALQSIQDMDDKQLMQSHDHHEGADMDSTQIIKQCQSLLDQLKTMEGSDNHHDRHECTYKYILEVETRLSDCIALSSLGSSLCPYWWHTKVQLRRIETFLEQSKNDAKCLPSGKVADADADASSLRGSHLLSECGTACDHADGENSSPAAAEIPEAGVQKEEVKLHVDHSQIESNEFHSKSPCQISEVEQKEKIVEYSVEHSFQLNPKDNSHSGEDMDMDVEMEVDDEIPGNQQVTRDSLQHNELPKVPPIPSDEFNVPPPSDEEWIPPPPPEDELVPRPPLDNPPATPTTLYAEAAQPLPYTDQYGLGYLAPSFQYYLPAVSESQSTTYFHTEGSHVAEQQPQYYEPVAPNTYTTSAAVISGEPVAYFDAHSQTIPQGNAVTSFDSSVLYAESGMVRNPASASTSFVSEGTEIVELATQDIDSGSCPVSNETEKVTIQATSTSVTSQATRNLTENGNAIHTSATTVQNPSKVSRSKKRTVAVAPTFLSNKKVSSLVDKWKAVREELHGDEDDEPEDAYMLLERKKQKEIEEWRARQIASGEAQDNANFLPLGGDWRERVKRKRAAESRTSESNVESVQAPAEEVAKEQRKPDLEELSRGLPSGWQVYWDESSKGVYYGNLNTSETTWTRPPS